MKNILIIPLLLAIGCKSGNTAQQKDTTEISSHHITLTDAQLKNAGIQTTTLLQREMSVLLRVNGKIDVPPQNLISVSVPLGGYLRSTRLLPGMPVKKGEVIATMEDQQYVQLQQDYLLAKSKLHFAELEYHRQKDLNEGQASSSKITQQAQAEVEALKITMNGLAEKLKLINIPANSLTAGGISKSINIYSGINGYVSKVNVNTGKYVHPADVLFELINPKDIHLNLAVFEKDIPKLAIGQKVMTFTNTHPEKKYPGEIILISKNINAEGTSEIHCHFDAYDKSLLPGTYMNAEVAIETGMVNMLPENSVVHYQGKDYVFEAAAKNRFVMIEITTGSKENGFVEITDAEKINHKPIVAAGAYTLLMTAKNKED